MTALVLDRCSLIAPFLVSPLVCFPLVAPELRIKRQNSSDSISSLNSITSHSSIGSSKDADAKKKKKKSWVGWAGGRRGEGVRGLGGLSPMSQLHSLCCDLVVLVPSVPWGQHWQGAQSATDLSCAAWGQGFPSSSRSFPALILHSCSSWFLPLVSPASAGELAWGSAGTRPGGPELDA